jgi:hypothetical protein
MRAARRLGDRFGALQMAGREELERKIEDYRQRFRGGPVGTWSEFHDRAIGIGFDGTGLFGGRVEFSRDGTGTYESWGVYSGGRIDFRWRPTAPWQIEITIHTIDGSPAGDPDDDPPALVSYDFFADETSGVVLMREAPTRDGEAFWMTTGPLCLDRP